MKLTVQKVEMVADDVLGLRLAALDGSSLPNFRAGAHVKVKLLLDAGEETREYSLITRGAEGAFYEIAVLLDPASRGGSRAMHSLVTGAVFEAEGPFNQFELSDAAARHVLIAGGIGITPILSMSKELGAGGQDFELHYAAKSRSRMAFASELEHLVNVVLYCSDESGGKRMPIASILERAGLASHVYVCGPKSLIAAVVEMAKQLGWPDERIHFEAFSGAVAFSGDRPIKLELRLSGRTILVQPEESILDAMLDAGMDPLYDCRRGECGMCMIPVIEGVPDHRDHALTASEKASGKVICTCVSRALSDELVLDF